MGKYAILDMEFTAWKGSLQRNWSFEWETREIINISSIKFNDLKKKPKEIDIICKPLSKMPISLYFQKLTGIKQNKINEQGIKFYYALKKLEYFFLRVDKIFVNGLDKEILLENCNYHKTTYPLFTKKIINIRPYFSKILKKDENKVISSELIKNKSNGSFVPHTGLYDCYSIYEFINQKLSIKDLAKIS